MKRAVAKIAVSAAVYSIDRPYSYIIPEKFSVIPGMRVTVPFGRGNRRCEGIVLSVSEEDVAQELKCIDTVLDASPVLTEEQISLALWMRDRFFCTLYEAVRIMLPSGMWFKNGSRNVKDKFFKYAVLAVSGEEAMTAAAQKKLRAPQQSAVLELMAAVGEAAVSDICAFSGASAQSVSALEKQGYITTEYREVFRRPVISSARAEDIVLSDEQQQVFSELKELMVSDKAEAALLFGVTGSGKTSIYIKLAKEALSYGKTAVILVPEIALTPQLVSIFSSHFGENVAVLHSSLSMGERYDEWKRIRSGEAKVVIGTRSAVFAPVKDLGLLVIDEEQEHTYKSENSPHYHARDVAKFRCAKAGALLLLGSATPSVDSMYNAREGRYKLFTLQNRYNEKPLPKVMTADLREEFRSGNIGSVSSVLKRELEKNIAAGEQSILFINRRGASGTVICGECGYTYSCPNCSVSMTYHSVGNKLMCHYCGHSEKLPEKCPDCGGKLKFIGTGTQKVEEELNELFPETAILRMDTDTVSHVGSHERILSEFRNKNVPILVGTQMVTKGLDFENVTLVGVISADQLLYASDYRAHERTFSLITQVVGRSGRGSKEGRAVIQTFTPDNEVIQLASKQDYMSFYEREIMLRRVMSAPPVSDMFAMTVSGLDEAAVLRGCVKLSKSFEYYFADSDSISVLGPAPAPVMKINNRFRYKLFIMCENSKEVRDIICHIARQFMQDKTNRGVAVSVDLNPAE